jgi:hypothetical protein
LIVGHPATSTIIVVVDEEAEQIDVGTATLVALGALFR